MTSNRATNGRAGARCKKTQLRRESRRQKTQKRWKATASRSVIHAWVDASGAWTTSVRDAAHRLADELVAITEAVG